MRRLATIVLVGGLSFSVYLLNGGTITEQVADAADAGVSPPNRDATCPVRLDPDFAADAGLRVYQRLTFPVSLKVLADGGRDVTLPPMPLQRVRQALDVIDWNDCSLSASTAPVAAKWGSAQPFTLATRPWCRAAAGKACLRVLADGGSASFGFGNVYPCAQAVNAATCERVSSGVMYFGDSETDL